MDIKSEIVELRNAEDIEEKILSELFVSEKLLKIVKKSDQTQVIIAPRGMGKTALVRIISAEEDKKLKKRVKDGILYIYCNFAGIIVDLDRMRENPELRLLFFKKYVSTLVIRTIHKRIKSLRLKKRKILFARLIKKVPGIQDDDDEFYNLIESYKTLLISRHVSQTKGEEIVRRGVGFESDLGPIRAVLPGKQEKEYREIITQFDTMLLDMETVASAIESVAERFELHRLIIVFDEVSLLPKDIQSEFFSYVKGIKGPKVSAKVLLIPPRYFPPVGARIGQDHFDDSGRDATRIDLYRRREKEIKGRSKDDYQPFLTEILVKRLAKYQSELLTAEKEIRFGSSGLFNEEMTLSFLCKCSHGNPRDFLELIQLCLEETGYEGPIHLQNALDAAISFGEKLHERLGHHSLQTQEMMDSILVHFQEENRKKFKIGSEFHTQAWFSKCVLGNNEFGNLIYEKCLYQVVKYRNRSKIEGWLIRPNFPFMLYRKAFTTQSISAFDLVTRINLQRSEAIENLKSEQILGYDCDAREEGKEVHPPVEGLVLPGIPLEDVPGIGTKRSYILQYKGIHFAEQLLSLNAKEKRELRSVIPPKVKGAADAPSRRLGAHLDRIIESTKRHLESLK